MKLENELEEVKKWSTTFYEPIKLLPFELRNAVTSLYLCLRAVDEIEDSDILEVNEKIYLLEGINRAMQSNDKSVIVNRILFLFKGFESKLDSVTLNFPDWIELAPIDISNRIFDGVASMSYRMIHWVKKNWQIDNLNDLDEYFYAVAGTPGLILSDIWGWYEGKNTNRVEAIGFGNYMQTLNILRGRSQDLKRGVNFFPKNCSLNEIIEYGEKQRQLALSYTSKLQSGYSYLACSKLMDIADKSFEKLQKKQILEYDGVYNKP